jgi:hypothetical protein
MPSPHLSQAVAGKLFDLVVNPFVVDPTQEDEVVDVINRVVGQRRVPRTARRLRHQVGFFTHHGRDANRSLVDDQRLTTQRAPASRTTPENFASPITDCYRPIFAYADTAW